MLEATSTGGSCISAALTGPPICASTLLTPIARNSVLLPDMLEPVTKRNVPTGPTSTSLPTAASDGSSGCAIVRALSRAVPSCAAAGNTQSG